MAPLRVCRGCGKRDFNQVVDLGIMAFTGVFPGKGESVPRGPLTLLQCASCSLVQLSYLYKPEVFFQEGYGYRSSVSKTMREHLKSIADRVSKGLEPGDTIIDIGSNDGTLLNEILKRTADVRAIGFDYLAEHLKDSYNPLIRRIADSFSWIVLEEKVNLITSISMLYDVNDLREFIHNISRSLAKNGLWITEQNYLPSMISNNALDFIGHEHATYLTIKSITQVASSFDLSLRGFQLNEINGGSVMIIFEKGADWGVPSPEDNDIDFTSFRDRIIENGLEILKKLEILENKYGTIYGLGASTRGNTLLQYLRLTQDDIPYFLEINPDKFGKRTPGSDIPIRDEKEFGDFSDVNTKALFVLPWGFREEIVEKYKGVDMLFPLPNAEIVEG